MKFKEICFTDVTNTDFISAVKRALTDRGMTKGVVVLTIFRSAGDCGAPTANVLFNNVLY